MQGDVKLNAPHDQLSDRKSKNVQSRRERFEKFTWKNLPDSNSDRQEKELIMKDHVLELMSKPLPNVFRKILERNLGELLPEAITWAQGLALGEICAPFLNGFNIESLRELRKIIEFRDAPHTLLTERQELQEMQNWEGHLSSQDRIAWGIVKMMMRRQDLYNLESPRFDALKREASEEIKKAEP